MIFLFYVCVLTGNLIREVSRQISERTLNIYQMEIILCSMSSLYKDLRSKRHGWFISEKFVISQQSAFQEAFHRARKTQSMVR